ncbi:PREDICTED: ephrin type-B receptor 4-like isoform X3 [Amphimedon queenslandica]|uniref:Protein kinase domain-containing protein n=1 Tax=Amphimedon queenslandica TaxID=400682 RepID=A0AAN0JN82_AMPQE|nr:PREDICTED: ephrin type-B receptor 4-like isoform X3 [Amphimedon queenslandica]|eukprot:XP_019858237.1 PREDICTED: ephrin type-B receptor 4-like isoform X3 [Amphimedon queenslandica]
MYYQQYNGPLNYELDSSNGLIPLEHNDYPLISAIIIKPSPSLSNFISKSSVARSSEPTVLGNAGNDNSASIIAAVVVTVLVLLIISIIVILILIAIAYKRRNKATLILGGHDTYLVNATYSDITPNGKEDEGLKGPVLYEEAMPVMNGTETVYGDTMTDSTLINVSNPTYGAPENSIGASSVYEEPSAAVNRKQKDIEFSNELYGLLEEATLYVPTAKKRSGGESEEIYSTLMNELYSSTYSRLDHTGGNAFFIEDTEYWEPDSNTDGIYQQLSDRKYREIIRHQIKVTDYLGSGQFGTVNKGVWTTPTAGSVSVAIKTLNDNTSEDERVKFLQEAAIMGQFHHPNVVKLHGVVTIGHPIMIVLELISGGDLKEYLNKFKPSPGELVLSSVPSILLSFCRQIASGMEYLSRKKFVHRDLAARNILVSDEGTGICKIADFGMSRDLQDESYYISQAKKIPIKWTAPEALHYKKYLSASDVWSYGAVMYEIWSIGHKPFEKDTNQECIRLVDSGYRLPPPPGCPKPMYKLMMQCWNPDTHNRPSFSDISSSLSSPDKQLLMINREDPVTVLGGALETSHSLYTDLQYMYKN